MFNKAAVKKLDAVEDAARHVGRGVYKRIDENRELLELLQQKTPQLMCNEPWIEGWLCGHDDFFVAIANTLDIENNKAQYDYPRTWPGTTTRSGKMELSTGPWVPIAKRDFMFGVPKEHLRNSIVELSLSSLVLVSAGVALAGLVETGMPHLSLSGVMIAASGMLLIGAWNAFTSIRSLLRRNAPFY